MMWFEELTGFPEISPSDVRKRLRLSGTILTSLENGQSWNCGKLEVSSLCDLRNRMESIVRSSPLRVTEVVADIQELHAKRTNSGALFQVASCLPPSLQAWSQRMPSACLSERDRQP